MNKEILEIAKEFHDTYEKLASEYTYETREDTKVFDINSNNGKLMYATVNEIVSPILKENQELKKQVEEYQQELEKADSITQSCIFNGKKESKISYRKCLNILDKKETQQKEFIEWLETMNRMYQNEYKDIDTAEHYNCVLQKYKEIIGGK